MSWSRNARFLLCEGGYLPVLEIVRLMVGLGWQGWMTYEVFPRTLADPISETPGAHVARAARSWQNLVAIVAEYRGGTFVGGRM